MIKQTLGTYQGSKYAKMLAASEAKVGKTCFLVGSLLGVLPWQKYGGVVDRPDHLHVVTFDMSALDGVFQFLQQSCGATGEIEKARIYNMQDDFRRVADQDNAYDLTFYNQAVATIQEIQEIARREKGVHALLISSLTGLAEGVERGIIGPPGSSGGGRGYGDQNKWTLLSHQLHELRHFAQIDDLHCVWEAHIDKKPTDGGTKESIRVRGEAGRSWGYNVEQVFRIRRQFGQKHPNTKVDLTHLDTRPTGDYVANGRGFTENLEEKEYDMTLALHKLGKQIGRWGAKKKEPKG